MAFTGQLGNTVLGSIELGAVGTSAPRFTSAGSTTVSVTATVQLPRFLCNGQTVVRFDTDVKFHSNGSTTVSFTGTLPGRLTSAGSTTLSFTGSTFPGVVLSGRTDFIIAVTVQDATCVFGSGLIPLSPPAPPAGLPVIKNVSK